LLYFVCGTLYTATIDLWEAADFADLAEAIVTQTIANRPALKRLLHEVRATERRALSNAQVRAMATLSGELGEEIVGGEQLAGRGTLHTKES